MLLRGWIALALCGVATLGRAAAVDYSWLPTSGAHAFHQAANWSPAGGPPDDANDAAIFAGSGDVVVLFTAPAQHDRLVARATEGEVALDLDGQVYRLDGPTSDSLVVGEWAGENPLLTVRGGRLVAAGSAVVGASPGAGGTLAIDAGGALEMGGRLIIGRWGTGDLLVHSGGQVISDVSVTFGEFTAGHGAITGPTSAVTTSANVFVGASGDGELAVNNQGRLAAGGLHIGQEDTSLGVVDLSDAGSRIDLTGVVVVAQRGESRLTVSGGAQFTSGAALIAAHATAASDGTLTVTGAGSRWINASSLAIANLGGVGRLEVSAGGRVDAGVGDLLIASAGPGQGALTVDGLGSVFAQSGAAGIAVGRSSQGAGAIDVRNGGQFASGGGAMSVYRTGVVNIRSSGSFTVNGSLVIDAGFVAVDGGELAFAAGAQLTLRDGGRLLSADSLVLPAGGLTQIEDGAARITTAGTLFVGSSSTLDLRGGVVVAPVVHVSSGSELSGRGLVDADVFVADSSAAIAASGGILTLGRTTSTVGFRNLGSLHVGSAEVVVLNQGPVTLGDATLGGGLLTVPAGGRLAADDSLAGFGTVRGTLENAGEIAPGPAAELVRVDGDYVQAANGRLRIELAGDSLVDRLFVTGAATLGGRLEVDLLGGFVPQAGQEFTILTYASRIGSFSTVVSGPAGGGLGWTIHYEPTHAYVTLAEYLPGDANGDGSVDTLDYQRWRNSFPACGVTWATGDFNGDGCATALDYTIWADYLSAGNAGPAGSAPVAAGAFRGVNQAVPEPATLLLAALAAAPLVILARRRDPSRAQDGALEKVRETGLEPARYYYH